MRNVKRSFRVSFRNLHRNSPRYFLCFPGRSKKSSPQISPDFSPQRFQISNQMSPTNFTAHFCRHGRPNIYFCALLPVGSQEQPKPKFFRPDIFGWGGGLSREWVGGKKFGMSLEPGKSIFVCGISRDCAGISRRGPKSLGKKLCSLLSKARKP